MSNKNHIFGGELKTVIKEQLDNVIFEQVYTPRQIYDKYYKDEFKKAFSSLYTDEEELFQIFEDLIKFDPTTQNDVEQRPIHMGKYSKWILNQYLKRKIKNEDVYKVKRYLDTLHTKKDRMKADGRTIDVTKFKDVNALYMEVAPYMTDDEEEDEYLTNTQEVKKIKTEETIRFHEDENWLVVIPKTERSACLYGKGTQWCTAATKADNMFSDYVESDYPDTNLYIFISKKDPKVKYQMHLESGQFMDVNDRQASVKIDAEVLVKILKNENTHYGFDEIEARGDYVAVNLEHINTCFYYEHKWFVNQVFKNNPKLVVDELEDDMEDRYDYLLDTTIKDELKNYPTLSTEVYGDDEDDFLKNLPLSLEGLKKQVVTLIKKEGYKVEGDRLLVPLNKLVEFCYYGGQQSYDDAYDKIHFYFSYGCIDWKKVLKMELKAKRNSRQQNLPHK